MLTSETSPIDRYLDRCRLQRAYDDCVRGARGPEFTLWKMVVLDRWLANEASLSAYVRDVTRSRHQRCA